MSPREEGSPRHREMIENQPYLRIEKRPESSKLDSAKTTGASFQSRSAKKKIFRNQACGKFNTTTTSIERGEVNHLLTQKASAKALISEGVIQYNRDVNDEMIMFKANAAKPLVCQQRKVSFVQRPQSSQLKPRSRLTTIN